MEVPPIEQARLGRAAGTYSQSLQFNTLQGLSTLPAGLQSVSEETAIVVIRGVGVPELSLLASGISSGVSGSLQVNASTVNVQIPTNAPVSFFEAYGDTAPSLYNRSPIVYSHEMTVGADNCYSIASTVVNGIVKIGVPLRIDHSMISRVLDSTVLKKNAAQASAVNQVSSTLFPDVGVVPKKRSFTLNETINSNEQVVVLKNESTLVNVSGNGIFTGPARVLNIPNMNHINLTEVPSTQPVPGYQVVVVLLKFSAQTGMFLEFLPDPPSTLQAERLPAEYTGIWVCTIMYAETPANTIPFRPTLIFGETINPRAAVFTGLIGNHIFASVSGIAAVPDGDYPVTYSLPVPALMSEEKWKEIVSSQNSAAETDVRRIEFLPVTRGLKRQRND